MEYFQLKISSNVHDEILFSSSIEGSDRISKEAFKNEMKQSCGMPPVQGPGMIAVPGSSAVLASLEDGEFMENSTSPYWRNFVREDWELDVEYLECLEKNEGDGVVEEM
jgi:hypothetical protein